MQSESESLEEEIWVDIVERECVVCLEEVEIKKVIYKCPCGVFLCNDCFVDWAS